jgi:hypothetical protein
MIVRETIEWHRDPADLPDADCTVQIELDPACDYSEPVFVGFYGDGTWYDVHGEVVQIIAWAHLARGTCGVQEAPKC